MTGISIGQVSNCSFLWADFQPTVSSALTVLIISGPIHRVLHQNTPLKHKEKPG